MSDITPSDAQDGRDAGEPSPHAVEPAPTRGQQVLRYVELLLACGWLLVPAAQYYGTFQRTSIQIEGSAASPDLATLDLTAIYVLLVAATAILLALRMLNRSSAPPTAYPPLSDSRAQP